MIASVGRIVLVPVDPKVNNGADVAPAIVTRVWGDGNCVNVRVLLDGEGTQWRTSATRVDELPKVEPGTVHAPCVWAWPPRV